MDVYNTIFVLETPKRSQRVHPPVREDGSLALLRAPSCHVEGVEDALVLSSAKQWQTSKSQKAQL